ncbi:MAG: DUF2357 domain-containing protein [Bacilli bacterium]|nr:DUF2357 domain-containing protein [Bacilli bacterium]
MASDNLDFTYRAFRLLRDLTEKDTSSTSFRNSLKSEGKEKLEATFYDCQIQTDWVNEIERCLPYLVDAIQEDRQFVKNEGETYPIEKIRAVSKDAIVDLSKHSNYITRKPEEGQPVIPDKLYQAHKETDYAVYENRFLFTLLDYLHDFLSIRLNAILEAAGKYDGLVELKKTIKSADRTVSFKLDFTDSRVNDPIARAHNSSSDSITRLLDSLSLCEALLTSDLMKAVSHAPKVSIPVVETNVFKYDKNFKECLAFFNFLTSYSGEGYVIKIVKKRFSPLAMDVDDEFKELAFLCSFLTYSHGNSIEKNLRKEYDNYLQKKKEEEDKKILEDTKRLANKVQSGGLTYEQYALKLEQAMRILEKEIAEKDAELAVIHKKQQDEIAEIKAQAADKLSETVRDWNNTLLKTQEEDAAKLEKAVADGEAKLQQEHEFQENRMAEFLAKEDERKASYEQIVIDGRAKIQQEHEANLQALAEERKSMEQENENYRKEKEEALDAKRKAEAEHALMKAELTGVRAKAGLDLLAEDFTSKERFLQLEEERAAFEKFFGEAWKKTKKQMRKEAFSKKPEKHKKNKAPEVVPEEAKPEETMPEEAQKPLAGEETPNIEEAPNAEEASLTQPEAQEESKHEPDEFEKEFGMIGEDE